MTRSFVAVLFVFVLTSCDKPVGKRPSPKEPSDSPQGGYLFTWAKPAAIPLNLPIRQSATCSFKKSLAVGFRKDDGDKNNKLPVGISYVAGDESEADTVAFVDLDTQSPKLRSNNGQATVAVLHSDAEAITVIHSASRAVEMY